MASIQSVAKNSELQRRIFFTLAMLAVYRIGVHVPTPGVNGNAVMDFFSNQGGLFGLFNTFSGGALAQFSVFALGIMPYISASIIFQLLGSAIPYFEALRKEGEQGRKKLNQYTRYGTIFLAIVQGYGMTNLIMGSTTTDGRSLVDSPYVGGIPFQLMTIITLTAGTSFVMWLAEQITDKGIGNGSSLIIFTGIAAAIPSGAQQLYSLVNTGEVAPGVALLIVLMMVAVIAAVVFIEVGQRKIPIQYSQRGSGKMAMTTPQSHLPLKMNFAGVIPPIFASSLLMFPQTMANFIKVPWLQSLQESLNTSGAIYNILFVLLIVFFCFFYTEIVFNTKEVAENLKKHGGFIPGIRAGQNTVDYINKVIERINVGGAIYLSFICVMPGIFTNLLKVPFYFGGTSLLILVGVALDTSQQIQSHLITAQYEGLMKGAKIRSRRVQF